MKLMSFLDQVTKMNSSQLDIGKITLTYRRPVRLYLPLLEGFIKLRHAPMSWAFIQIFLK